MCFEQDISVPYAPKEGHFRELKLKVPFKSLLSKAKSIQPENSISSWNEIHKNTVRAEEPKQGSPNTTNTHTPVKSHNLFEESSNHFSWLLELQSEEAERDRRAAVVSATSAGLEPSLPFCGRPLHVFHRTKFFMLRPVFKKVWLQRNLDLTKQLSYPRNSMLEK